MADVTCSDAKCLEKLIAKAGVPYVAKPMQLVLPPVQTFVPALDAQSTVSLTGLPTANVGIYDIYFRDIPNNPLGNRRITVTVVHQYPRISMRAEGKSKAVIKVVEDQPWVYSYVAVVKGAPPEYVLGKPKVFPFVAVIELQRGTENTVDIEDVLQKAYGGAPLPIAYAEIEVYAIPKVFANDEMNKNLVKSLELLNLLQSLQAFTPKSAIVHYYMEKTNDSNLKSLLQKLLEFTFELSSLPGKIVVYPTPAILLDSHSFYMFRTNEASSIQENIVINMFNEPLLNSGVFFSTLLNRLQEAMQSYLYLRYYDGKEVNEEEVNNDPYMKLIVNLQKQFSDLENSYTKYATEYQGDPILRDFSNLLSVLFKASTPEPYEISKLYPFALFSGIEIDVRAQTESGYFYRVMGDAKNFTNGTSIRLPEDVQKIFDSEIDEGVKKYDMRVYSPAGIKVARNIREYLKIQKGDLTYDPVTWGYMYEVIVNVDRDRIAKELGMKPEEASQYSDRMLLQKLLAKWGIKGTLDYLAFSTTIEGEIVDIVVPIGLPTVIPALVVDNSNVPVNPVYSEIHTTKVNKNPDVLVRATVDQVRLLLQDWGYVKKHGFNLLTPIIMHVSKQQNNTVKNELITVVANFKNVLIPAKQQPTTVDVEILTGNKTIKTQVNVKDSGGYRHIDLNAIRDAVNKELYGGNATITNYLTIANMAPKFVWIPNVSKYRYNDMTYRVDWPAVINYFATQNLSDIKLNISKPNWVAKLTFEVTPIILTQGKPMMLKQAWTFTIDVNEVVGNSFVLELRIDREKGIELGSEEQEIKYTGEPIYLKLPATVNEIGGVVFRIVDDQLNPVLYKPYADSIADQLFNAIQQISVRVEQEGNTYKLVVDGPDKVTLNLYGVQFEMSKTVLAGILQAVGFLFFGLEAYGIIPTETGYAVDPYVAVNRINQAKIYATPYLIMSAIYGASAFQVGLVEQLKQMFNITPYVIQTPEALTTELYSLIVMAPPDTYKISEIDIWHGRYIKLVLNNPKERVINVSFDYTIDGQTASITVNTVELMGKETTEVYLPLRDLAFLALIQNIPDIATLQVPILSFKFLGQSVVLETQSLGDALMNMFKKAWHSEGFWNNYHNALDDPDFLSSVVELFQTADEYNNGKISTLYPYLYELIVNGILNLGFDRVTVQVSGAILDKDYLGAVNEQEGTATVAGFDAYFIGGSGISSPINDITDAETKFVQKHDLVNKILQWYRSENVMLDQTDAVYVFLSAPKKYTIVRGQTTAEYIGWEKFSVVSLIPLLIKPSYGYNATEEAIRDMIKQAITDGTAVNLIKTVGHMPYFLFNFTYERPIRGGAETRTLSYRVNRNTVLMPRIVERILRMYTMLPTVGVFYLVDDRGGNGYITIPGYSTKQDIVLYQKSEANPNGQLPSALTPVRLNIRPAVTLEIDHPLVYEQPTLVIRTNGFKQYIADIDYNKYYKNIRVEFYRGTTLVKYVDVYKYDPNLGASRAVFESLQITRDDGEFWRHANYAFYLVGYTTDRDRIYGTVILDEANLPIYGYVNLAVGSLSESYGALKKIVQAGGVQVIETTSMYRDLWNMVVYFYSDNLTGILILYRPIIQLEVDYDTRIVTATVSGVPTTIVNAIGFDSYYGPTTSGGILRFPGLKVPLSPSQMGYTAKIEYPVLPRRIRAYPVISTEDHDYIMPGVVVDVTLREPQVSIAYDENTGTVKGQVTEWGYSPKVKVRVCGANTGVWCRDVCLERPFDYTVWLKLIEGKTTEKPTKQYQPTFEVQVKDTPENEPLMVVAFIYDGYGNLIASRILKRPESRVYKAGGNYYVMINPATEALILTNNIDATKELFDIVSTLSKSVEAISVLPLYYAKGIVDDVLTTFLIPEGADITTILQFDPEKDDVDTFIKTKLGEKIYEDMTTTYGDKLKDAFLEAYYMAKILTDVLNWTPDDIKKNASYVKLAYILVATGTQSPVAIANTLASLMNTTAYRNAVTSIGVQNIVNNSILVQIQEGQQALLAGQVLLTEVDTKNAKEVKGLEPATSKKIECIAVPKPPINAEPLKLLDAQLYEIGKKYGLPLGIALGLLGLALIKR